MSDKPPADRVLDVRGLICPLPVLKARKALEGMAAGRVLRLVATDPRARADLTELCASGGHVLVACEERGGEVTIVVRRGPAGCGADGVEGPSGLA